MQVKMKRLWLGRWSLLTIAAMLLCIMQGTWQKEAEEPLPSAKKIDLPRYFKTDTDSEVILILSKFLKLTDPCAYDVTIVNSENPDELALYWNRTAILLKHSSSMNYTREYTVELTVFYRPNCDSSVGSENVRPVNVTVKLRPLQVTVDIHLVSSGELVEGQPLKLTCTVVGHTPKGNDKVKIHYWSSGERIANCSSNTTELLKSDIDHDMLTSTCELSAHSTQSNSGDYSCSASIGDMVISSADMALNVEPRIDWKTIIGAAVGSGAGLIVLAFLAIVISYKIRNHRNPRRLGAEPGHEGPLGENAPLLGNGHADIRDHVIMPGFNQHYGVDDHRGIEANLDQGEGGRGSPANSDKPSDHDSFVLPDQGGYESTV